MPVRVVSSTETTLLAALVPSKVSGRGQQFRPQKSRRVAGFQNVSGEPGPGV